MYIKGIDLSKLPNARHIQFHNEIYDVVIAHDLVKLKVADLILMYETAKKKIDYGFQKVVKSEFTEKMKLFDLLRNKLVVGIGFVINGNVNHFDPSIAEKANRIKINWDAYGSITTKPIYDKTAIINNITDDLIVKLEIDSKAIHIYEWLLELRKANNDFYDASKKRVNEEVAKTSIVMKDARKHIDNIYKSIINRVYAHIQIEGLDEYLEFVKTVNILVGRFGRTSGKSNIEKDEETNNDDMQDNKIGEDNLDDKYPDAREWYEDFPVADARDGDIFYIIVDDKKVYYRLLDQHYVPYDPRSGKYEGTWELLG